MDSIAHYYHEINHGFLDQDISLKFDIYSKVENGDNEPTFVKFADYSSSSHKKILDLLKNSDGQSYFIHETDLIKYYKNDLIKGLYSELETDSNSLELLQKTAKIATRILKEYFENIGSPRLLRTLSDIVAVVEGCLAKTDFEFSEVFKITNKENHSYTHCVNVGLYSMVLASKLKMKPEFVRELGLGAMLADIGKKDVPHKIIFKDGQLDECEFKLVRKHPASGKKVLNDMKCFSPNILKMVGEHHEQFNGEGYPLNLSGERISLYGRLCTIIDVFSALTSKRYNHDPHTPFEALTIMKTQMPGHFDERIFVNLIKIMAGRKTAA